MDKFQFAKLVSFVAGLMQRRLDDYELKDLDNLTNVTPLPVVNLTLLFTAIIQRRKIEAIKEYRTLTGFDLRESKDEVERLMFELANSGPSVASQMKEGA